MISGAISYCMGSGQSNKSNNNNSFGGVDVISAQVQQYQQQLPRGDGRYFGEENRGGDRMREGERGVERGAEWNIGREYCAGRIKKTTTKR